MSYRIRKLSTSLEGTLNAITQSRTHLDPSISIVNAAGYEEAERTGGAVTVKDESGRTLGFGLTLATVRSATMSSYLRQTPS